MSGFYYNHRRQELTKSNHFRFQILPESKQDDLDCFIDFKIIENDGGMALNKQSEKQNCQTHGVKNQLTFGKRWYMWEG